VEIHERVDLRAWTALGVGGVAAVVARCHSESGVRDTLDLAAAYGVRWVTLGGGSRLVASDRGLRVPVVSLTGSLARWEPELDGMVAGGGANLAQVCRAALRAGLSGLGLTSSGTHSIGGLVTAAADGVVEIGDVLDWVDLQRPGAAVERWRSEPGVPIPRPEELRRRVVIRVRFRLHPAGMAEVQLPVNGQETGRTQRSTGPVFLDRPDSTAADLLAEAGCSSASIGGVRLGGSQGNRLIAGRSATASDVLRLCRQIRDRVHAATGESLSTALVFVDERGEVVEP
jgi:UDP-N-acetylmuramate dehydrogenase